jgi:histidine triad (HIT) family protein
MNAEPCIFCEIVAGRAPASRVYEDEEVIAFLDIRPVNPGHTLVVPRAHFAGLSDLNEEVGARMFRVARRLAAALRKAGVRCEGVNLFLADGEAAFQEVMHVHLHVLPRFAGDPFKIQLREVARPPREELDRMAEQIRREVG